jgi:hypothetical protein
MATYRRLPPITLQATPDQTGANPGNWTNYFSSSVLAGMNVSYFEWIHAAVSEVPAGASAVIVQLPVDTWGATAPGVGGVSEYAPPVGMPLQPGTEFAFLWTAPATGTPIPLVTCWFRYDLDDPANRWMAQS